MGTFSSTLNRPSSLSKADVPKCLVDEPVSTLEVDAVERQTLIKQVHDLVDKRFERVPRFCGASR